MPDVVLLHGLESPISPEGVPIGTKAVFLRREWFGGLNDVAGAGWIIEKLTRHGIVAFFVTLGLVSICANLFVIRFRRKMYEHETVRGMLIATMIRLMGINKYRIAILVTKTQGIGHNDQ